jgi:hypothetical protein
LTPNDATLMVDFQGIAKEFADALMLKSSKSMRFNIYEISHDRLRIELTPVKPE